MVKMMHIPSGLKLGVSQSTNVLPAVLPSAAGVAAGHLERGIAWEPFAAFRSKEAHLIPDKAPQPQTPLAQ